jgi:hypothetical protein
MAEGLNTAVDAGIEKVRELRAASSIVAAHEEAARIIELAGESAEFRNRIVDALSFVYQTTPEEWARPYLYPKPMPVLPEEWCGQYRLPVAASFHSLAETLKRAEAKSDALRCLCAAAEVAPFRWTVTRFRRAS